MARKIPDITQHVAMRVRVTRMFVKLSLEEASVLLGIPVWLLSYKENGLINFTLQDFTELERVYKISWLVFFQDYFEIDENHSQYGFLIDNTTLPLGDYRSSDAIMKYLSATEAEMFEELSPPGHPEGDIAKSANEKRGMFGNARRCT